MSHQCMRVTTHQEQFSELQAGGQYLGNMVTLWSEHTNSRQWSRLLRSILALRPIPAPTAAVCVLPDVRQCTLRRWTGGCAVVNHHGRRDADIRGVSMSCYLGFKGEETQRQAIHCESMRKYRNETRSCSTCN